MQCSQIRGVTLDYALGELGPAGRLWVDVHTAHCPACRRELEDACELAAACERALAHPRPVDDFEALMARIASREARPRVVPVYGRWSWGALAAHAAAVAAVAALVAIAVPAARDAGEVVRELHHLATEQAAGVDVSAQAPLAGGPIVRRLFELEREYAAIPPADPAPFAGTLQP